ncbi:MAG: patatin-like phospholipase family protein [Candidatus Nanopelagicales bacterium]
MSRALICGGGGSVGTAWESGWFAGLQQQGIWLNDADLILGTSAGAGVGVQVACGHDMMAQVNRYRAAGARAAAGGTTAVLNIDTDDQSGFRGLFERGQASGRNGDVSVRKEIAEAARAAVPTIELEAFLRTFKYLADEPWPASYKAACLNIDTYEFEAIGADLGGSLQSGVAAGCAVPGVYPPIQVGKHFYVDGGCLSPTSVDLGIGYDKVLVLLVADAPASEMAALEASGTPHLVIDVDPEVRAQMGDNLMDAAKAFEAAELGLTQGLRDAAKVAAFWKD